MKHLQAKEVARIANDFVLNSSYQMPAQQHKILLYLISKLEPLADHRLKIRIPVKELETFLVREGTKRGSLYKELRDMMSKITTFSYLYEKEINGTVYPGSKVFITDADPVKIGKDLVSYEFKLNESLRPFLLQLYQYVRINPFEIKRMKSGHSIRLFCIFSVNRSKQRSKTTITVLKYSIEQLKELLALSAGYERLDDFKRRVINVAVKEINEYTNISISYENEKQGRKVVGFKFTITDKDAKTLAIGLDTSKLSFAQVKSLELLTDFGVKEQIALHQIMPKIGGESVGFEDRFIMHSITIFNKMSKIKSPGAYVNWWTKQKDFVPGTANWTACNTAVTDYKKHIQLNEPKVAANREMAKGISYNEFRQRLNTI